MGELHVFARTKLNTKNAINFNLRLSHLKYGCKIFWILVICLKSEPFNFIFK